ncbi:MAG: N-acetyltransferase [Oscillospiraceae bacterium]|nr:N-acetyltransferase [Oscillospiraceae bacterium]
MMVPRLRPYLERDGDCLLDWMEDEVSLAKWCGGYFRYPLTAGQLLAYQADYSLRPDRLLLTAADETGAPLGHMMFKDIDYEENSVHLGHIIIDPSLRNQGMGKQMLRLSLRYAFWILGLSKATLTVFHNNPRACRCYGAVGFRELRTYQSLFPFHDERWSFSMLLLERDRFDGASISND